ncbi:uncharacterized protein C7orf50 homolog [Elgaria multicarinata webbii]|uniref:uncharacterized protein C7orf50 homolog n=1 Tax=Elgaria multicarinata webbii TaxID=159646 RepID=UPI002FCCB8E0
MANDRKTSDMKVEKKKKKIKHPMSEKKKVEKEKEKMKHPMSEKEQQVHEPELKKQKLEKEKQNEEEEEDHELSAEEKRTLERKLKKERKKEQKKLMREARGTAAKEEESKKPSGSELALDYLTTWSESPKEWKFQKTRQTWLLLHMYDQDKVPDKYFSILLRYLEGLQGSARSLTVQKAEVLMKEYDNSEANDPSLPEKCERIRKVLQLLS